MSSTPESISVPTISFGGGGGGGGGGGTYSFGKPSVDPWATWPNVIITNLLNSSVLNAMSGLLILFYLSLFFFPVFTNGIARRVSSKLNKKYTLPDAVAYQKFFQIP